MEVFFGILFGLLFILALIIIAVQSTLGQREQKKAEEAERDRIESEEKDQIRQQRKNQREQHNQFNKTASKKALANNPHRITHFSVRNGKGALRGSVIIEVNWEGDDLVDLYVTKNQGELYATAHTIRGNSTTRIGHETNGAHFSYTDFEVKEKTNFNYYCWLEGQLEYQAYVDDKFFIGGTNIYEVSDEMKDARVDFSTRSWSRSITVTPSETKEEWINRQLKEKQLEKKWQAHLREQGQSVGEKGSLEDIVQAVLAEIKAEQEIADAVEQAIEKHHFDEETAEYFRTEIMRRYYDREAE